MTKRRSWIQLMNATLRSVNPSGLRAVDLFCGAGGLSLGFWAHGIEVVGVDINVDAAETYARNLGESYCADIKAGIRLPDADILIAGPPCQPWSRAGKRLGREDDRDGFPITIQAVEQMRPTAVVVENVPGSVRSEKRDGLDYIKEQLRSLNYLVSEHVLNAADYGVPQNRSRIFVVGIIGEVRVGSPKPWQQAISVRQSIPGTYWRNMPETQTVSDKMSAYISRYERASGCRTPRDLHIDKPSRTLTARNLSGATGDMMRLKLSDGTRRTLTVGEAARLQSFPDWFQFHGSKRSKLEQIGNAVPPMLSYAVAEMVLQRLVELKPMDKPPLHNYPVPSSSSASATMRANRRRDTAPELRLRSAIHRQGLRFRVDLPIEVGGRRVRPDIVFTRRRVAVFVDGCFWHACPDHGQVPRANQPYWTAKLEANKERDRTDTLTLQSNGWNVLRIWEHEQTSYALEAVLQAVENVAR